MFYFKKELDVYCLMLVYEIYEKFILINYVGWYVLWKWVCIIDINIKKSWVVFLYVF